MGTPRVRFWDRQLNMYAEPYDLDEDDPEADFWWNGDGIDTKAATIVNGYECECEEYPYKEGLCKRCWQEANWSELTDLEKRNIILDAEYEIEYEEEIECEITIQSNT